MIEPVFCFRTEMQLQRGAKQRMSVPVSFNYSPTPGSPPVKSLTEMINRKISLNENHLDDTVDDQHFDRRDLFHKNKSVGAMQTIIFDDLSPLRDHPHRPI